MAKVSAVVPDAHLAKLESHARANDRTLSAEVRRMLRLYVAMLDRQGDGRLSVEPVSESSSELVLQPIERP